MISTLLSSQHVEKRGRWRGVVRHRYRGREGEGGRERERERKRKRNSESERKHIRNAIYKMVTTYPSIIKKSNSKPWE